MSLEALRGLLAIAEPEIAPGPNVRGPDAALAVLGPRITPVYHAASGPWPEADAIDHVHDIRVATRRLRAALAITRDILGKRAADRSRAKLEAFGDVLGARRAADVNLERLDELRAAANDDETRAVIERLAGLVAIRRLRALDRLRTAYPPERLARHGHALLSAAQSARPDGPTLAAGMQSELEKRLARVKARLGSMQSKSDDAGHHGLRIALKRLRYTCEIIRPVLPDRVPSEATGALKTMQDALGKLHDEVELIALVNGPRVRWGSPAVGVDAIVGRLSETKDALFAAAHEKVEAHETALIAGLS